MLIYDGKLIKLYRETVKLPNGHTVQLELVRHPGAALIIPFLERDTILMLRQFRAAAGGFIYELPAGTRGSGETWLACAKREIIEETGYAGGRFTVLGDIIPVPGYSTERIRIYKAERLVRKTAALEADEVATAFTAGRKRVRALFKTGKIKDAKTICALAMAGWL